MFEGLLYYFDFYVIPGIVVLGVVMMHLHLRRGNVNLARRSALVLPMLLAYWAWIKFLIPYSLRNPWYFFVIFIVTGALIFYFQLLFRLYSSDS